MKSNHYDSLYKLHLVLNYEQSGNFTKFQSCIERCSFRGEDDYFTYNLLQALSISAAINLSWEDSGLRWTYNIDHSHLEMPKESCFNENLINIENKFLPLIETRGGLPLCLGTPDVNNKEAWSSRYFDKFMDLPRLIDLSVRNIGNQKNVLNIEACYSFETFTWKSSVVFPEYSCLFRVSGEYSGYSYYLYDEGSALFFKIKEIEIAYLASSYLLNLDFKKIIRYESGNVYVPASYRLPTFISRYLFANSEQLLLDVNFVFKKVSPNAYECLINYLSV